MKKFFNFIIAVAVIFSISSCAIHSGLTGNMNSNTTNVVLQDNNYKIIQKVKGEASGMSVLGIFGGSFRPLVEKARVQMLESANLIGKSRAIINETVEVNNKFFVIVGFKTVTVSAYVIEFINADVVETNETVLKEERETENEVLKGRWVRKSDGLEISIEGNVGIFTQIKSGEWLTLLKKGKVNIGAPKIKDITKTGKLTWQGKDLIRGVFSFSWDLSLLTLNEAGDELTVGSGVGTYILLKVKEQTIRPFTENIVENESFFLTI